MAGDADVTSGTCLPLARRVRWAVRCRGGRGRGLWLPARARAVGVAVARAAGLFVWRVAGEGQA